MPGRRWRRVRLVAGLVVVPGIAAASLWATGASAGASGPPPIVLEPTHAVGLKTDTLFLGGYARGNFEAALQTLASDLSGTERTLVGRHLDKIFAGVLDAGDGLRGAGRLRLSYERSVRPDGSTRSVRVLAAEVAVSGGLHTALYYERDGRPGYFDYFGRSLDPDAWAKPLLTPARVSSPFGLHRMHPILRRVLPHTGVDYAAASGTPVYATADGIVAHAAPRGGYGKMVEVRHPNGYSTRYAHLSRVASGVERNGAVRQGDLLGFVGMSGRATGPHLHYEVRRSGRPVDPQHVASGGVPGEIRSDPGWALQRREGAQLLARTPTTVTER